MAEHISFKRGDTFSYSAAVTGMSSLTGGTGWGIASQIRNGSTLLHNLQVTATARASYDLAVTGSTASWPIGAGLRWDVKYTSTGANVSRTETALIEVVEEVTA